MNVVVVIWEIVLNMGHFMLFQILQFFLLLNLPSLRD